MPYFKGSTANPTGVRPWDFALQGSGSSSSGLGSLRGRLGFYTGANYVLPARTLGDFLPRMPMVATSPYSGKADYGDPPPVYTPLNPEYFRQGRLGRLRGGRMGVLVYDGAGRSDLIRAGTFIGGGPILPGPAQVWQPPSPPSPVPIVSATGLPVSPPGVPAMTWQQQQSILAQNQAAQQAAAATAAQAAAAASSQAAVATATPAEATAPSWFTDPTQELITGLPNWGLLAIAGGTLFLLKKK